jgi:ActR/RegA family two-component response regulator
MAIECLLLTSDSSLVRAIGARFAERGIEILMRKDAASAVELSMRRHLDGFVVDCDDLPGGKEALRKIPANPANKRALMIAILGGRTTVSEAFEMGANFVLAKPVQDSRIYAVLDTAVPKMEREHRRYFRHEIDLPVELQVYTGQCFRAKMLNVSEGGFAVRIAEPLGDGVLSVRFDLPSIEPTKFSGRAVVVWASNSLAGLRFLYIEPPCRVNFHAWLNSLEAQLRFRSTLAPVQTNARSLSLR